MTRLLSVSFIVLCLITASSVSHADDIETIPTQEGRITDTAHILSSFELASMTSLLADFDHETGHQIAVLTVPTLGGEAIESFSLRVAKAWRLGHADLADGILITLAMRERRVRIEVGAGMERFISDPVAKSIIEKVMVPSFRRGDIAGGLRAGLMRLMDEARKYQIRNSGLREAPVAQMPSMR